MKTLRITLLDRYILKKFLGTYLFAMALIIAICIVFDVAEKIDDFISEKAPLSEILFDYYLNFIPYFVNMLSSLFVFISVIFITSQMANRSEIIAILSSGVSFNRLLYPYFVGAAIIFCFSLLLANFVIPPANRVRIQFEHTYISRPKYTDQRDIHKQVRPGLFVYLQSYNPYAQVGYKLAVEQFENNRLTFKLWADMIEWDSIADKWQLARYYIRQYSDSGETVSTGTHLDTSFYLVPKDLARTNKDVETMNYFELNDYIDEQRLQGASTINVCLFEKYNRVANPFAAFILTIMGVSVSSRKVRGGMGKNLGFGLALSFTYILFQRFAMMFSIGGGLSPLLAVWIPNFIFMVVAFFIYRRAAR